jgi:hypothetical protein
MKGTTPYLMIALGALLLLAGAGLLGAVSSLIWLIFLFGAAGIVLLSNERRLTRWQRLFGFVVIAVVGIISSGRFAGTAVLGFPALGFIILYLKNQRAWWALLPGGALASLALLIALGEGAAILFLGLAATFTLLYLRPVQRGGKRWALYPAIGFIILTVLTNDPSGGAPNGLITGLLISLGVIMLWWWQRKR